MNDFKTVDDYSISKIDELYKKQKEDVSRMRASLLSCSVDNPSSMVTSIQNITVMRIYHQLNRIIRYTELMDKLENKLYESIDHTVDNLDSGDAATWMALLEIQDRLQKSMIESHKLLQPYMDARTFNMDTIPSNEDNSQMKLINAQDRENIRNNASKVIRELNAG